MAITRSSLQHLNEAQLRTEVLIPLFSAMGYRDIVHYHAGVLEQGKDLLMWKSDDFRGRETFGVVVKAARISGQVTGRSSAGEVVFQVQQTIGSTFRDPVTMAERSVDRCLVVTSRDIRKEAVESIGNALKAAQLDSRVDLIDGNKLWQMIEQYLPDSAVMQKLEEVQSAFESASEHHRIVASVVGDTTFLSTQPKHPDAYKQEPINVQVRFKYPDTPEGRDAHSALEAHVRTGAPVSIPGEFIDEISLPELIRRFLPAPTEGFRIELGPRKLETSFLATVRMSSDDGVEERVEGVEFRAIQVGTEEVTLDNGHQPHTFHFTIRIDFAKRSLELDLDSRVAGNVKRAFDVARFARALAMGGKFSLEAAQLGLPLGTANIPPGSFDQPDEALVRLLEEGAFIQSRTGIPIFIGEDDITVEQAKTVFEVAQLLRDGTITGTCQRLVINPPREAAEELIATPEMLEDGRFRVYLDYERNVFGTPINLGIAEHLFSGLTLTSDARDSLIRALAEMPSAESYRVTLLPSSVPARVVIRLVGTLPDEDSDLSEPAPADATDAGYAPGADIPESSSAE